MNRSAFTRQRHGDVAVVLMDAPGPSLNVIDESLLREWSELLDELEHDDSRGIVLASGKTSRAGVPSFGAGSDIRLLPEMTRSYLELMHHVVQRMATFPKPIVAAVDGFALGGSFELALGCTSIVASDRARLGLPESTLGLIPAYGGTQFLLPRISAEDAVSLMCSGASMSADEAVRQGLVDDVAPADLLVARAADRARQPIDRRLWPTTTVDPALLEEAGRRSGGDTSEAVRAAVVSAVSTGLSEGLDAGLARERDLALELLETDDAKARIHRHLVEDAARRAARTSDRSSAR